MVRILLVGLISALLTWTSHSPVEHSNVSHSSITLSFDGSTLSGTITIPPTTNTQRTFRGSAYRSRRTSGSSNTTNVESSPQLNTIISLHPTSYELSPQPSETPSIINQENATFIPHVTPVIVGSIVEFINNDSFYHNVFSLTPGAKFNIGRRPTGDVYSKEIPRTQWKVEGLGEIQLFCDIHSSMNAVILSLDTPYFTRVSEDHKFEITDIPAGTYEIRGYNPGFEIASEEVTLDGETNMSVNLNFMN